MRGAGVAGRPLKRSEQPPVPLAESVASEATRLTPDLMHLDDLRDHCLAKPGATEGFPFGDDALVFKVAGKMFALASLERLPPTVTLKCDPERALDLRERHEDVRPGYHMNKRHWNTVGLRGDVPGALLRELVDHSYALVVGGLPRRERDRLAAGSDGAN